MIYKSIVGSRSYGLSVEHSDVDMAMVSDKRQPLRPEFDVYLCVPSVFVERMTSSKSMWFDYQWLFPHEFCIENGLSRWISENCEDMVKAMLPDVYHAYATASAAFARNSQGKNKRIMYAIHFRNMLANYADGMTFAEALKPTGTERAFLLSVRNGIAPKDAVLEANRKARERANAVAGFYDKPRADSYVLDEFRHMVYREVEKLQEN